MSVVERGDDGRIHLGDETNGCYYNRPRTMCPLCYARLCWFIASRRVRS